MKIEFNRILLKTAIVTVLPLSLFSLSGNCVTAATDDFNDGNDNGWSHYEPLAPFGVSATYSFPTGVLDALEYGIQMSPSPNPASTGPARAGSLLLNEPSGFVRVDLHGWDNTISQSFGAMARITQPGFGTTDGYAVVYSTAGLFSLLRIDNEVMTVLDSMPVVADPARNYQLTVTTAGGSVFGELHERPDNLPIASVFAFDSTYRNGLGGVFAFANTVSGAVDARFDFYQAAVPEPSTWTLLGLGAAMLGGKVLFRRAKGPSAARKT